jgi:hypothetical protein
MQVHTKLVMSSNFATSKNFVLESTMFPYHDIHKYTWTSPEGDTQPDG